MSRVARLLWRSVLPAAVFFVAATLGIGVSTVYRWKRLKALKAKHRGTTGERTLRPDQEKFLKRFIRTKLPNDLDLPFARWPHAAVAALIEKKYGIVMPIRTAGRGAASAAGARVDFGRG